MSSSMHLESGCRLIFFFFLHRLLLLEVGIQAPGSDLKQLMRFKHQKSSCSIAWDFSFRERSPPLACPFESYRRLEIGRCKWECSVFIFTPFGILSKVSCFPVSGGMLLLTEEAGKSACIKKRNQQCCGDRKLRSYFVISQ